MGDFIRYSGIALMSSGVIIVILFYLFGDKEAEKKRS